MKGQMFLWAWAACRPVSSRSEESVGAPLFVMVVAVVAVVVLFASHLRRIVREMARADVAFDLAEKETKMEFTIAERESQ